MKLASEKALKDFLEQHPGLSVKGEPKRIAQKPKLVSPLPQYRSQAESAFAETGWLSLEAFLPPGRRGVRWVVQVLYEPVRLKIPGGFYTPDFLLIPHRGIQQAEQVFVEVKGNRKQKNYRDARSKLRAAAEVFWYWKFIEARRTKGGWTFEEIIHGDPATVLLSPSGGINGDDKRLRRVNQRAQGR